MLADPTSKAHTDALPHKNILPASMQDCLYSRGVLLQHMRWGWSMRKVQSRGANHLGKGPDFWAGVGLRDARLHCLEIFRCLISLMVLIFCSKFDAPTE